MRSYIQNGWPTNVKDVNPLVKSYFKFKEEISVEGVLVFKGSKLIVPKGKIPEVVKTIHKIHIGIESSIRRAKQNLYWPQMNTDIRKELEKCSACMTYISKGPAKQELRQHEVPTQPW